MNPDLQQCEGSCHCRAVRFSVTLTDGLHTARRCTCSYCRMRGAIAVSAEVDDLVVHTGQGNLQSYQFNTNTAKHYFCRTCGIYTHHQRRSNPDEYGVNVAILKDVSPFDFAEIPVGNGRCHPSDGGGGQAGTLTYRPAPA